MEEKNKKKKFYEIINSFISFAVMMIVLSYAFIILFLYADNFGYILFQKDKNILLEEVDKIEKFGQIGDFIGGTLNPLFALFSFMLLLITIKIQNKTLETSQEELELTRNELSKSATAQQDQSNSIKLQNFENTFFNMVSLHNEIVKNLKVKNHIIEYSYEDSEVVKNSLGEIEIQRIKTNFNLIKQFELDKSIFYGKEALEHICSNIDYFMNIRSDNEKLFKNIFKIRNINLNRKPTYIYDLCHESYSNIIGHYFGNIYQILKFISTTENIDKRKYSDLFRAQFSSKELNLLFYHCSASIGSTKFKPLIEKFEFLEHLNIDKDNEFFKYIFYHDIYKNEAFGVKDSYSIELLEDKEQEEAINRNKKIELLKNEITNLINTEISKIYEPEKYKYLDLYKYFSEKDIEIFLSKVENDSMLFTNLVAKKLAIVDYSKEDSLKNYTFKEE